MISLKNIGKRYNYEWIFRNVNYEFTADNSYVILGANGSGKSTLLQLISGSTTSSEGVIEYDISTDNYQLKTTNTSQDIYTTCLRRQTSLHARHRSAAARLDVNGCCVQTPHPLRHTIFLPYYHLLS